MVRSLGVRLEFLEFPVHCTCDGRNESPAVYLHDVDCASIAIWVTNPFIKTCCSFTPWVTWNIPATEYIPGDIPKEPVVRSPIPCIQGITSDGTVGYSGPCPPPGETHRYQFRVYGLDSMVDVPPGSPVHDLVRAMKGHVLQYGETVALYSR